MTTQHTPTPWRVRHHPSDVEECIVVAPTPEGHPYFGATKDIEIMGDESYPTKKGDAAIIVLAGNAYDSDQAKIAALLAAAEAVDVAMPNYHPEWGPRRCDSWNGQPCSCVFGKLRAAIAQAEESSEWR